MLALCRTTLKKGGYSSAVAQTRQVWYNVIMVTTPALLAYLRGLIPLDALPDTLSLTHRQPNNQSEFGIGVLLRTCVQATGGGVPTMSKQEERVLLNAADRLSVDKARLLYLRLEERLTGTAVSGSYGSPSTAMQRR